MRVCWFLLGSWILMIGCSDGWQQTDGGVDAWRQDADGGWTDAADDGIGDLGDDGASVSDEMAIDGHDGGSADEDASPEVRLEETDEAVILSNHWLEIRIDKNAGQITGLLLLGRSCLSAPAALTVRDRRTGENFPIVNGKITSVSTSWVPGVSAGVTLTVDLGTGTSAERYSAKMIFELGPQALRWDAEVQVATAQERELNLDFVFPILGCFDQTFWGQADAPYALSSLPTKELKYGWFTTMLIPLVSFFQETNDLGLTLVAPVENEKPGLIFRLGGVEEGAGFVEMSNTLLRASGSQSARAGVILIPHRGDWRPGLDWLYHQYQEYFEPVSSRVVAGEGFYCMGGPFVGQGEMADWRQRGVAWEEFHAHFPFYGLYAPQDRDEWALVFDQDTVSLDAWEADNVPSGTPRTGYAAVNAVIDAWHSYQIQSYIYFQAFEAWHQYAERYFPADISRDAGGNAHPAWYFCNLMNPDPEGDWGRYIISQLQRILDRYPEVDGLFYDRADYNYLDYAHDDGVTMSGTRRGSKLDIALAKMNERLFSILHTRGKGVWTNGPTSLEVCRGVDGIMAEAFSQAPAIQFLGLHRPTILLVYDSTAEQTELKSKVALWTGAFPGVTYGGTESRRIDEKYRPLFEQYKGKRWVLRAHALKLPPTYKGNIFSNPAGDLLVSVVSLEKSQLNPDAFQYDVPIRVDISEPIPISYCYLFSGDVRGIGWLDCSLDPEHSQIQLPAHLAGSLLLLSSAPRFEVTRASAPVLMRGESQSIDLMIQNISSASKDYRLELSTPWGDLQGSFVLGPQQRRLFSKEVTIPSTENCGEFEFQLTDNEGKTTTFSVWVTDVFQFEYPKHVFLRPSHLEDVTVKVFNNTSTSLSVALSAEYLQGSGSLSVTPAVDLGPRGWSQFSLRIQPDCDQGVVRIRGMVPGHTVDGLLQFERAMVPQAGDLFSDEFSSGSMSNWNVVTGNWQVSEGAAVGSGSSHLAVVGRNLGVNDYRIQVNTRIIGSSDTAIDWLKSYVFFRYQDSNNFYRFGIHGDAGVVDLYRSVGGVWTLLASSPFTPQKGKWYTLTVEASGPNLKGFLDGLQVLSATDTTFAGGGVGIGVLEDSMVTHYDDVVVREAK
ncbi:MAG: family 16 glycoside hydrolase [candidate division WOR-3 bacterium]